MPDRSHDALTVLYLTETQTPVITHRSRVPGRSSLCRWVCNVVQQSQIRFPYQISTVL